MFVKVIVAEYQMKKSNVTQKDAAFMGGI